MIKELVVHLGDTKTGSTSIQNALLQGACQGAGVSVFYPTGNHHNMLVRTLTRKPQFKDREFRFNRIYQRLLKSEDDIGVISAEHFQFVHPDLFIEAVDKYWPEFSGNMRLIAYVRPHAEKLLSSFAERTKLGHVSGSFESFVDKMAQQDTLDYLPRFTAWRDRFGDRFELRPFVRGELYRQDPVADFFRFMLGHEDFQIGSVISSNTSLTLPQLALLRDVHAQLMTQLEARGQKLTRAVMDARATMGRSVAEHMRDSGLGNDGARMKIPAHLEARIRTRYAEDAAALDKAFFTATPMSDAISDIKRLTTSEEQSLEMEHYFSSEVRAGLHTFSAILSGMLLEDPKQFLKLANTTRLMFSTEQDA